MNCTHRRFSGKNTHSHSNTVDKCISYADCPPVVWPPVTRLTGWADQLGKLMQTHSVHSRDAEMFTELSVRVKDLLTGQALVAWVPSRGHSRSPGLTSRTKCSPGRCHSLAELSLGQLFLDDPALLASNVMTCYRITTMVLVILQEVTLKKNRHLYFNFRIKLLNKEDKQIIIYHMRLI